MFCSVIHNFRQCIPFQNNNTHKHVQVSKAKSVFLQCETETSPTSAASINNDTLYCYITVLPYRTAFSSSKIATWGSSLSPGSTETYRASAVEREIVQWVMHVKKGWVAWFVLKKTHKKNKNECRLCTCHFVLIGGMYICTIKLQIVSTACHLATFYFFSFLTSEYCCTNAQSHYGIVSNPIMR